MLERIKVKNFRCLRNVTVPLRPLTVLVGPNDSGKSAFLMALQYLTNIRNLDALDPWRAENSESVEVEGEQPGTLFRRRGNQGTHGGPLDDLLPISLFQLPSTGIEMHSSGYSDEGRPPDIDPQGRGIPSLLDHLLRRDRKRFFDVVNAMKALVRGFEEIEIATPDAGSRRIDFLIEHGFRISGDRTSVGLRLMLFFVTLAHHPYPSRTILLEEPENGVHPKRLADVMKLLREITQGILGGHAAQVILTTHSPYLLDQLDLAQDQVLVFKRNDDGSRTAEPADAERLKTFLDEFMLGEVWYNEGEAGLVGPAK